VSLLHRGTETVTVFPEETFTDADCNTRTRPSSVGVVVRAVVQPMTSTEHQTVGFETESKSRLRLAQAVRRDPRIYNGSRRTAHRLRDRAPIATLARWRRHLRLLSGWSTRSNRASSNRCRHVGDGKAYARAADGEAAPGQLLRLFRFVVNRDVEVDGRAFDAGDRYRHAVGVIAGHASRWPSVSRTALSMSSTGAATKYNPSEPTISTKCLVHHQNSLYGHGITRQSRRGRDRTRQQRSPETDRA
jgi:hypothetical protein